IPRASPCKIPLNGRRRAFACVRTAVAIGQSLRLRLFWKIESVETGKVPAAVGPPKIGADWFSPGWLRCGIGAEVDSHKRANVRRKTRWARNRRARRLCLPDRLPIPRGVVESGPDRAIPLRRIGD